MDTNEIKIKERLQCNSERDRRRAATDTIASETHVMSLFNKMIQCYSDERFMPCRIVVEYSVVHWHHNSAAGP
jgi:hypothetical protein